MKGSTLLAIVIVALVASISSTALCRKDEADDHGVKDMFSFVHRTAREIFDKSLSFIDRNKDAFQGGNHNFDSSSFVKKAHEHAHEHAHKGMDTDSVFKDDFFKRHNSAGSFFKNMGAKMDMEGDKSSFDVSETDTTYVVTLAIPKGFKKGDLKVELTDANELVVRGSSHSEGSSEKLAHQSTQQQQQQQQKSAHLPTANDDLYDDMDVDEEDLDDLDVEEGNRNNVKKPFSSSQRERSQSHSSNFNVYSSSSSSSYQQGENGHTTSKSASRFSGSFYRKHYLQHSVDRSIPIKAVFNEGGNGGSSSTLKVELAKLKSPNRRSASIQVPIL